MKTIGVVTDGLSKLEIFLNENIRMIFKDNIKINNYFFNNLQKGQVITDDIVLVMLRERSIKIKEYVDDSKKIIILNRSVKQKDIYKLFSLPKGMDVLVVNDNEQTILETMSTLYHIGINHLNLIPYDKNNEYKYIKVCVTPGEVHLVPEYIDEIIDIGHRFIDISTFLQILTKLNIDNKEITERLIKYSEEVISLHSGINHTYKNLTVENDELKSIINLSKNGMILISNDGEIKVCNESVKNILDINFDIVGKKLNNLEDKDILGVLKLKNPKDEVVKFKNKYITVNKHTINSFGKEIGFYFCIQEITYIKKLEQNLSKMLRDKGQIARYTFDDIKTNSVNMENTKNLAKKIAKSDYTVLITGESGTGKELFAQSIHNESDRRNQPFIAINCAAMPENLLESELFGYEEGAFTGALKGGKKGLFEQAHNGTVFLDEIGDMPMYLQIKLLRVLQENQVMRVGGQSIIDIDVRVIAATNRDLPKMIKEEKFRSDLYYRINVLPIHIPPLRERKDDINMMLKYFIERDISISEKVKSIINSYNWPGNIRELRNTAMYINTMSSGEEVSIDDLPYNLINIKKDYKKEIDYLKNKTCIEKTIEVMKCIDRHNKNQKSSGRSSIYKELSEKGVLITEGEVRHILEILKEEDIVLSNSGRKGSELSNKGLEILTALNR
ncbi:sigma-54 dependent transcriptional regulator,Nitrogen regulation protein NR(I),acetoacetate metabolism regulatory protein AtoC,Transcriptional regulator containing PAS, AAA-type ATPase, and DNA-binding domains,Nif-specific regulatory protein,Sigma-54 interaction domain [[Clostridium] sordellii]|uniref:sigma-54 interaction domain-containing protein n=1 Tax=Paraclostridium sordellii TaxID=1505 RepID=UPI000542BC86|nr:sigma 54-interacting transcriptional regulator [Paeniclostridium sordellii]CEK36182.1 sigma-54 dependent transcriptional regulator,Nitrogen regulation protein NR(I),acetoacetate metabolism regulatory protein AtoC,Transcriptional regulator containing PAS, AAA-type ATPase, and DNA-binding domains,Nif-specific regulatory protein,Sigma-54 interaction domain [[Clostridium] sordellii] [Paeniclostridium sordellii]